MKLIVARRFGLLSILVGLSALLGCEHKYVYLGQSTKSLDKWGRQETVEAVCDMTSSRVYKRTIVSRPGNEDMVTTEIVDVNCLVDEIRAQHEIWKGKTCQQCEWDKIKRESCSR